MEKFEIDSYVKAGEIAKEVKVFARGMIRRGVKLIDIAEGIDAKILELGGAYAFPVNLSLNEVAAHFTPAAGDEEVAEGILKIDIGVAVDGFIADTAFSLDLSKDGRFGDMIRLNEKILSAAADKIFRSVGVLVLYGHDSGEPGCGGVGGQQCCPSGSTGKSGYVGLRVCDIGEAVQGVMNDAGDRFAVIKNLSGHALGRNTIHAGLTISNYRNDNKTRLDDIAFAVEPFVTTGVGDIFEGKGGGIYILNKDGQVRDRDARKLLEFIRNEYTTRPFCARWLSKGIRDLGFGISEGKVKFVLGMLVKQGILHEYPMLIEKSREPVSQAENTFVVSDGNVICTTG